MQGGGGTTACLGHVVHTLGGWGMSSTLLISVKSKEIYLPVGFSSKFFRPRMGFVYIFVTLFLS